jgi:phosphomannomutase
VPKEFDEKDSFFLGLVFGHYMKSLGVEYHVMVGMDNRQTSFNISNALCMGLNELGVVVRHIGVVPTPLLYHEAFLSNTKKKTLGIMVTASHNPTNYNGFKVVFDSKIVDGTQLIELIDKYGNNLYIKRNHDDYLNYIFDRTQLRSIECTKHMKVLWDCNNGATKEIVSEIVKNLPIQSDVINTEDFITSQPDPTSDLNIDRVKKIVSDYDIAFCFDGDGDRLLVVMKDGEVLRGDRILLILAKQFARGKVVVDIKTSNLITRELEKIGFEVVIQKTGHSFIKSKMDENRAVLGGEVSGHLFFQFHDGERSIPYDDAILAALYVLKFLIAELDVFHSTIQMMPKTFSKYDVKIECSKQTQISVMTYLLNYLKDNKIGFLEIDGLKHESEEGWWLVRQSNTENALIICIESKSEDEYKKYAEFLAETLKLFNLNKPKI